MNKFREWMYRTPDELKVVFFYGLAGIAIGAVAGYTMCEYML